MTKKQFLFSALALSMLGMQACTDDLDQQATPKGVEFTAVIPGEDGSTLSKAAYTAEATNNTGVDKIVVYGDYSRWRPFEINLSNGKYTGTGADDVVWNSKTFVGLWPDGYRQDDGNFKMTFPSRQEPADGWYGSKANLMIDQCTASNKKFEFNKVYSCIRLYVYEQYDEITVNAINGDTYLSGDVLVNPENGAIVKHLSPEGTQRTVTLTGPIQPGTYNLAVAPGWVWGIQVNATRNGKTTQGQDLKTIILEQGKAVAYEVGTKQASSSPNTNNNASAGVQTGWHVAGKQPVNGDHKVCNMYGFAQTYSPWFNERGTKWTNYNVQGCLNYNKGIIDRIMNAGWKMTWMRLHMDNYWSNDPSKANAWKTNGMQQKYGDMGERYLYAFDFERFKKYFNEVFKPMAEYAQSKGLAVVMRPPGVCPAIISTSAHYREYANKYISTPGGNFTIYAEDYQAYLIKVWTWVAQQPGIKGNPNVQFELANEPVYIWSPSTKNYGPRWENGRYIYADDMYAEQTKIFQSVVDAIRAQGCDNVIWVPGCAYQGDYRGYVKYPIKGSNIGFAVHCYPGWFSSAGINGDGGVGNGSYQQFYNDFNEKVGCVAKTNPIIVTEMDWARQQFARDGYIGTWGTGYTGTAGGSGFGANFKKIADSYQNVSYLTFVWPHILAQFNPNHREDGGADGTGLYDKESGVYPVYQWFKEYSTQYPWK
ncbi:MAG: glycoside hydrolase family 5 protein [Bacteroidales bacterium]|nr:glycoside hydrolase family 5 protein [Bacteroidales bacterium]